MVKVPYSFETGSIAPGYQSVDADYDGAYDGSFTSREETYIREGDPQPIYRVDGNERRLSEFRGKYLLVDVWG